MIREALESDLPRIVELGARSLKDGPYAGIIEENPEQMERCARAVFEKGKILVAEEAGRVVGLLGFLFEPHHHFSGEPYAAELMWYVEAEFRATGAGLKLLWEAEKIAKQMGAKSMVFTAPNSDVAALYRRFGYEQLEVTFRKVL